MIEKIFGIAGAIAEGTAATATAAEGEVSQVTSYPDFCCFLVYADSAPAEKR